MAHSLHPRIKRKKSLHQPGGKPITHMCLQDPTPGRSFTQGRNQYGAPRRINLEHLGEAKVYPGIKTKPEEANV